MPAASAHSAHVAAFSSLMVSALRIPALIRLLAGVGCALTGVCVLDMLGRYALGRGGVNALWHGGIAKGPVGPLVVCLCGCGVCI